MENTNMELQNNPADENTENVTAVSSPEPVIEKPNILDDANIKELQKRIHQKNEISVKKDDPILILVTCFEYLLELTDNRLDAKSIQTISMLQQATSEASSKIQIKYTDELTEAVSELLHTISEKNSKEFEMYAGLLTDAKTKLEILTAHTDTQINWIRAMVWFNLSTAVLICFATLIFMIKII